MESERERNSRRNQWTWLLFVYHIHVLWVLVRKSFIYRKKRSNNSAY